ncbi:unnamed protein product [Rotaria sp. Silwood2]|nr:unnamed protein product [Rotaria sp. Silwood2]CAF2931153.1 unnamed protein product [Rotaria sp. Silwood2]CAF3000881.1 unnamed protein product [Rotaria sp. Silwood2]CAF3152144.1 unnamed protein product [Rotaria sp. Silwood2]CAF3907057.1 unnamed protein product [Rotaria sp. Silwood2]
MSSSGLILIQQANYAAIFIQPIHLTLTIVTNTLNIFVLYRRTLRSFPCTRYFLVYSIFSILYACFTCPLQFLRSYGILWTNTPVGCRMQTYIFQTTTSIANLMILLASIDRFCSSSQSAKFRSISCMKTARWIIFIGIIVYTIYMSPLLAISYWNNTCLQYSSIYITIYMSTQITVYYGLTLLLMALFSLLTIFNIRQQLTRVGPMIRFNGNRRTEGQLCRMLLIQIIAYLLFTLPIGVIQILMTFLPSMRTPLIQGLRLVFVMWQQCIFFLTFFLFIASGSIYRQEMIRLFKRIYKREDLTQTHTHTIQPLPGGTNTKHI